MIELWQLGSPQKPQSERKESGQCPKGRKEGFGQSTMANGAAIEFRIITEIELIFARATLVFE